MMNYCNDFDVITAILQRCEQQVKMKLIKQGGSCTVVEDTIVRMRNYLQEQKYFTNNGKPRRECEQNLRKITFFLALNTEASFKYDLKTDPNIVHVLDTTPKIPKNFFVLLVWELKLDRYFYELISYSPCWFSFQLVGVCTKSLKHLDPFQIAEKVPLIIKSIFVSICRSDYSDLDQISKKRIFTLFYDTVMELLRNFYTPDASKFEGWKKRKTDKYLGVLMKNLLEVAFFCFKTYENHIDYELEECLLLYRVCTEACPVANRNLQNYSPIVRENQMKIISALLNAIQFKIMSVTVETFLHWNEFDDLQQCIGELSYEVLSRIETNPNFHHDIQDQLKAIAIKPKSIEEQLKGANIGDILLKLDQLENPSEKKLWLNELINRPIALGNNECVSAIKENINLVSYAECVVLMKQLDFIMNMVKHGTVVEPEEVSNISELLLQVSRHLTNEELLALTVMEIKIFGVVFELFEESLFTTRAAEFLNKLNTNFDRRKFLLLSFQDPFYMYENIISLACEDENKIPVVCDILSSTKDVSHLLLKHVLLKTHAKHAAPHFPKLLSSVFLLNVIKKATFYAEIVHPKIVKYLDTMNLIKMQPYLKSLELIATRNGFENVTPPVVVDLASIMEKCRWYLTSYSFPKETILNICIHCLKELVPNFSTVATDRENQWIAKSASKFSPINRFYFQMIFLKNGEAVKYFDEFLHPEEFQNNTETKKFIASIYAKATSYEVQLMSRSPRLKPHITEALLIVLEACNMSNAPMEDIYNFSIYCISTYKTILKKLVSAAADNQNELKQLALNIVKIVERTPPHALSETFQAFGGDLLDVMNAIQTESSSGDTFLTDLLQSIKNSELRLQFQNLFN